MKSYNDAYNYYLYQWSVARSINQAMAESMMQTLQPEIGFMNEQRGRAELADFEAQVQEYRLESNRWMLEHGYGSAWCPGLITAHFGSEEMKMVQSGYTVTSVWLYGVNYVAFSKGSFNFIQRAGGGVDCDNSSTYIIKTSLWNATSGGAESGAGGTSSGGGFPLDKRVSSYLEYPGRFGDPRDGGNRKHGGADLYAPVGTNVYAVKSGTVVRNPYKFYRGSYAVEINHGDFIARYCEINAADGICAGSTVTQGQFIGTIADLSLNRSMLHFEMYSGDATGPLTNRANLPYMRRSDLIDPTHFLNSGY